MIKVATGLQHQQWNIDAKTVAPSPYLPSPSPLQLVLCLGYFSSSSKSYNRENLIQNVTQAVDFGRCEEDQIEHVVEHIHVCRLRNPLKEGGRGHRDPHKGITTTGYNSWELLIIMFSVKLGCLVFHIIVLEKTNPIPCPHECIF